jgi:hypothetical protein
MSKIFLVVGITMFLFISCEKENNGAANKSDKLQISMGGICGWCGGSDSLLITQTRTYYESFSPCDSSVEKMDTLTAEKEWNELVDLLDLEEFRKIDINTCYVCVDGCDTWITVKDNTFSHTIRYGYNDSTVIQNIRPFVDKLQEIKAEIDPVKHY